MRHGLTEASTPRIMKMLLGVRGSLRPVTPARHP